MKPDAHAHPMIPLFKSGQRQLMRQRRQLFVIYGEGYLGMTACRAELKPAASKRAGQK